MVLIVMLYHNLLIKRLTSLTCIFELILSQRYLKILITISDTFIRMYFQSLWNTLFFIDLLLVKTILKYVNQTLKKNSLTKKCY